YRAAETEVEVENGASSQVSLALEALPGKLLISVNVAAECSAGGQGVRATPDGVAKLEVGFLHGAEHGRRLQLGKRPRRPPGELRRLEPSLGVLQVGRRQATERGGARIRRLRRKRG